MPDEPSTPVTAPATPSGNDDRHELDARDAVLGRRVAALLLDFVVLFIGFLVMAALFGDASSTSDGNSAGFSLNLSGAPGLVYFVLVLAYFVVQEALSGQTLGKRVTGVKVVAVSGELSWGKALVRTLFRFLDGFPYVIPYLLGFIVVLATKKKQRVGDIAAGTVVVRA